MNYQDEISKLKEQINKLEWELKQEKQSKWKPEYEELYWYKESTGEIYCTKWTNHRFDNWHYSHIPIFKTREECENYWAYHEALDEASYKFSEEEWKNENIDKWFMKIDYSANKNIIIVFATQVAVLGVIYFESKKSTQAFIDKWHDEILKYGI